MGRFADRVAKALKDVRNGELFSSVPAPQSEAPALYSSVKAIKSGYEQLSRQRGETQDSALLIKELDVVLEKIIGELDTRYLGSAATSANVDADTFNAFLEDIEHIITQIQEHLGNSDIHGGGDTIIEGDGCCIDDDNESAETSWSSQKTKNELPHALYSTRHTDVRDAGGSPKPNQGLMAARDGSNQFQLTYPTIWRGAWFLSTYYRGDQVEDEGWLMTCNAEEGTEERAGPQIHGGETFIFPETPTWTMVQATGLVKQHMQIVMEPNLCQQFRVWPALVGPLINHYMEVIIRRGGAGDIPVSRTYFNPFLIAGQWNVLQFADAPLPDGTLVDVNYFVIDASTETSLGPYDYIYEGAVQNGGPPSGQWNVSNQRDILRISKTDADGFDRSAELLNGKPGSRVLFVVEGAIELSQEYFVLSDPIDLGDYVEYLVNIIQASGAIDAGARCLGSGIIPTPQATDYVKILNYFPGGNPVWGTCTTSLEIGGVPQAEPNTTGFGMDVGAAPGIISDKWDYNNYSELSTAD